MTITRVDKVSGAEDIREYNCSVYGVKETMGICIAIFEPGVLCFSAWIRVLSVNTEKILEIQEVKDIIYQIKNISGTFVYENEKYKWIGK